MTTLLVNSLDIRRVRLGRRIRILNSFLINIFYPPASHCVAILRVHSVDEFWRIFRWRGQRLCRLIFIMTFSIVDPDNGYMALSILNAALGRLAQGSLTLNSCKFLYTALSRRQLLFSRSKGILALDARQQIKRLENFSNRQHPATSILLQYSIADEPSALSSS